MFLLETRLVRKSFLKAFNIKFMADLYPGPTFKKTNYCPTLLSTGFSKYLSCRFDFISVPAKMHGDTQLKLQDVGILPAE